MLAILKHNRLESIEPHSVRKIRPSRKDLLQLCKIATHLIDRKSTDSLYQFVADQFNILIPGSFIMVSTFNPQVNISTVEAVGDGSNGQKKLEKILGKKLVGLQYTSLEPQKALKHKYGWLIKQKQMLIGMTFPDIKEIPFEKLASWIQGRQGYIMPLIHSGTFLGTIILLIPDEYSFPKLEVVKALAKQTAIAFDRKRLEDEAKVHSKHMQVLAEITQALSDTGLDFKTNCQRVTDIISNHIGDLCAINILKDKGKAIELEAFSHPAKIILLSALKLSSVLNKQRERIDLKVAKTCKTIFIPVGNERSLSPVDRTVYGPFIRKYGFKGLIIVPLITRRKKLGVIITARNINSHPYTENDKKLLEEIAHRVAVALDNSMLYQKAQEEIDHRIKTEAKLKESEQRFVMALKDSRTTVFQQDNKLRYVWAYNLPQYINQKNIIGKTDAQFFPPEEVKDLTRIKKKILRSGVGVRLEQKLTIRGKHYHFDVVFEPFFDEEHNVIGLTGVTTDITAYKRIEYKLIQSEKRFNALYESNFISMFIGDIQGHVIEANEAFLSLSGYSAKDVTNGKVNWLRITAPEHYERNQEILKALKEHGSSPVWEKEYIRKDGNRVPVLLGSVMIDAAKGRFISFMVDISQQKEQEKRKDDFISMASHELKTPLTSLKVYGQILKRQFNKAPNDRPVYFLAKMDQQLNRLNKLVNDLLEVSRLRSGKLTLVKELFDPVELVKECVEDIQMVSKKHRLILRKCRTHKEIMADRGRIGQVIMNLLTNAIKYSPEADKVNINVSYLQETVVIKVRDYGIGIPEDKQKLIFEPFYRINEANKQSTSPGLGLGLHIAMEIVKRHLGTMTVESKENKGSVFTVCLPFGEIS